MRQKKYNKQGVVGAIVIHAIILILLILGGFKILPKEEEGIVLSHGYEEEGTSSKQKEKNNIVAKVNKPVETSKPLSPKVESSPKSKQIEKTQDFEDAPEIKSTDSKEISKRDEELKKNNAKKEQEITDQVTNQVSNAFSKVNNSLTGENKVKSENNNPGSGVSLNGRSLLGVLPPPKYTIQEEGIVVVKITVNKKGEVTSAEYLMKGSTTQHSELIKAAIIAAKKAKFNVDNDAPTVQKGTITYQFELN